MAKAKDEKVKDENAEHRKIKSEAIGNMAEYHKTRDAHINDAKARMKERFENREK